MKLTSKLVPLKIRAVGTTDWLDLVCLSQYNMPMTTTVNTVQTFCGPQTATGSTQLSPTGTAVCETQPVAGQISQAQMADWQLKNTEVEFKAEYPGSGSLYGQQLYLYGKGFVSNTDLQLQEGNLIAFTWTITGTDNPSNVPFD